MRTIFTRVLETKYLPRQPSINTMYQYVNCLIITQHNYAIHSIINGNVIPPVIISRSSEWTWILNIIDVKRKNQMFNAFLFTYAVPRPKSLETFDIFMLLRALLLHYMVIIERITFFLNQLFNVDPWPSKKCNKSMMLYLNFDISPLQINLNSII